MHYYSFNISDFNNSTRHLSRLERSIYRDLIDYYYDKELPLPKDIAEVSRKIIAVSEDEISAVKQILKEFFTLEDGCYTHHKIEKELSIYRSKADTARANGKLGGRPKKPIETQPVILANPEESGSKANQELITNNHKPITNIKDIRENSKSLSPVPYAKILELYHSTLPELSKVEKLTDKRKSYIRQRWISKDIEDLDTWKEFFEYVKKSKFLTGQVQAQNGRKTFRADLEWLTKESNFVKIWEGNYHGEI